MRILLFLLTNLAVLIVAGITLTIVQSLLGAQGMGGETTGLLVFCAVFGMAGSLVSLLMSKWLARRSTGTRIIDPNGSLDQQQRWLLSTVTELAASAGIKTPEVGIFPSPTANAFATGWNRNAALVAVSDGLLQRFQPSEAKAVLAHEIGHVANGDMVTLALIQGVVNTFVMFFARLIGQTVDRVVFKSERGYGLGYWVTTIFAEMVLGVLASIIVFWFSRRREFRADAAGASLAGRNPMIAALQRLRSEQGLPSDMPGELNAFGINGGFKRGIRRWFATHPPLEARIAALQQPERRP